MRAVYTAEEVIQRVQVGLPIEDCVIRGDLMVGLPPLGKEYEVHTDLRLCNAEIDFLGADCVVFHRPVHLVSSHFRKAGFYAAYFLQGLEITDCVFDSSVAFMDGGHNAPDQLVRIANTVFREFVDFNDCYYEGPVEVVNCTFEKGTNLIIWVKKPFGLGERASILVTNNSGVLDLIEPLSDPV